MNESEHVNGNERVHQRRRAIKSFKAKADSKRTVAEKFADLLTSYFGTVTFLALNVVWFVVWIVLNMGYVPSVKPFDPFPFGLLTMIVSLEAIILAIVVLISQNREARIAELREEIDLQINTIAEEEITKLIQLQLMLLKKHGVAVTEDFDLHTMTQPIQSNEIERRLEEQLNRKNGK